MQWNGTIRQRFCSPEPSMYKYRLLIMVGVRWMMFGLFEFLLGANEWPGALWS